MSTKSVKPTKMKAETRNFTNERAKSENRKRGQLWSNQITDQKLDGIKRPSKDLLYFGRHQKTVQNWPKKFRKIVPKNVWKTPKTRTTYNQHDRNTS